MASCPITSWEINGETVSGFIFLGSKITADGDCSHEIKRHSLEGKLWPTWIAYLKALPTNVRLVKALDFPVAGMNVRVGWWRKLSTKELMLLNCGVEDSWESLRLQGDQSWVFIGRTYVESESTVLWPPHAKSWLIGKDPNAGKDWGQEEKGTKEDEMAGWHHWLEGHGFG